MDIITNKLILSQLKNHRFIVTLSNLGASIISFKILNSNNEFENIAMGIKADEGSSNNNALSGSTVGPVAGRIKNGTLKISETGSTYNLELNDGNNHIHGGSENLSNAFFNIDEEYNLEDYDLNKSNMKETSTSSNTIIYSYKLNDGVAGYPGNRLFKVKYELLENGLLITYTCTSDKDTYVNITNHSYWNLSGNFDSPISGHKLYILADRYVENDACHIPMAIKNTDGSLFDFRNPSVFDMSKYYPNIDKNILINEDILPCFDTVTHEASRNQLKNARGYNNAFLLNKPIDSHDTISTKLDTLNTDLQLAAELSFGDKKLSVMTDYPSVVVYSGGYLGKGTILPDGTYPCPSCAVALECQECPDAPNFEGVTYSVLKKDQTFCRHIAFLFH